VTGIPAVTQSINGSNGFILVGVNFGKIGASLAVGDVNHDTIPDLLIGTGNDYGSNQEVAYIIFGQSGGAATFPSASSSFSAYTLYTGAATGLP
jgi:hypothetical protein